ncbi:MAG: hypothetical protein Q9182_004242 [Xanthomendoza sp. 2 TL-2023]
MSSTGNMAAELQASLDPDWVPHPDAEVDMNATSIPHIVRDERYNPSNTSLDPVDTINFFDNHLEGGIDPPDNGSPPLPRIEAAKSSKLSLKIRDQTKKNIQLDATDVKQGPTRINEDQLEYLHQGVWKEAVYHYRIRGKLLRMMDAKGRYEQEPERGLSRSDRTAFKSDQQSWQMKERSKRPDCLFLWEDPNESSDYTPTDWYDEGRIVLGSDGCPVKKWRELPLTISGQCEGFRIEAWRRLNPNIRVRDIVARMPKLTSKGKKLMYKDIKIPALANRCTRDRCKAGLKAWNPRDGSRVKERRLMEMIPFEIQQQIVRENSTRCFRDLTDAEIAYIEVGNKGTEASLKKAGSRMLSIEERQKRLDKKQKQATNSKKHTDVGSLQIHPVFEDAISKPGLNRIRRGNSAAPEVPNMKRRRDEDLEDTDPNADSQIRRKKPRFFRDETLDLPSMQNAPHIHGGSAAPDVPNTKRKRDEDPEVTDPNADCQVRRKKQRKSTEEPSDLPSVQNTPHNLSPAPFENPIDFSLPMPAIPENWEQHQLDPIFDYNFVEAPEEITEQNLNNVDWNILPNDYIPPPLPNDYIPPPLPNLKRSGPDFRFQAPTTTEEQNLIQEALQITHDDCQFYLGLALKFTTNQTECYAFQLNCIQDAFNLAFDSANSILPYPPLLRSHDFWTDSMDGFRRLPTVQQPLQHEYPELADSGLAATLVGAGAAGWEGGALLEGFQPLNQDAMNGVQHWIDSWYGGTYSGWS